MFQCSNFLSTILCSCNRFVLKLLEYILIIHLYQIFDVVIVLLEYFILHYVHYLTISRSGPVKAGSHYSTFLLSWHYAQCFLPNRLVPSETPYARPYAQVRHVIRRHYYVDVVLAIVWCKSCRN